AIVAIVLFIAFSFRKVPTHTSPWKFGICAIVALVHDVLITSGVFALLGLVYGVEIDGLFITALLTVMGFSVHDTIVVFDRLRENLKQEQSMSKFANVANDSLNQTMARSINTSISTLFTLVALLFLGSNTLFFFLLALVVGIIVGTWSSIFIATPLLVAWQKK
ncbi:MAG: protein translocase subunit SecF, partial [Candidatus Gracilibacteria bacterium]|nr:protein translocase subunit SecF [Candidatus Gracilibacteria bacterium]